MFYHRRLYLYSVFYVFCQQFLHFSAGVRSAIFNSLEVVHWDVFIELSSVSMFVHLVLDEFRGIFVWNFSPFLDQSLGDCHSLLSQLNIISSNNVIGCSFSWCIILVIILIWVACNDFIQFFSMLLLVERKAECWNFHNTTVSWYNSYNAYVLG